MHHQSTNNVLKILGLFKFLHDNYDALPQDSRSVPELVLARLLPFQAEVDFLDGKSIFLRQ